MEAEPEVLPLNSVEAAIYLAKRGVTVAPRTLRRWATARKIRHLRLPNGRIAFRCADLDAIGRTVVEPEAVAR